jgi:cytochrome oxidase Cu insertion factor (SCO1/SenC/PrrC family)
MMRIACAMMIATAVSLSLAQPTPGAEETRLIDQYGQPLDARALAGHWLLVYFGYANCPDVCPTALTKMTAVLYGLGPAADSILPLFVTLDPDHDSTSKLREFAAHFYPRLRALTGSPAAIADAAQSFGVPWNRRSQSSNYIDHGMWMYLANPNGQVVQVLHPHQPVSELVGQIQSRLAEHHAPKSTATNHE